MTKSTLHFFCGKMGSGKSTAARTIAEETKAVLLSEDEWLGALYPGEIQSVADYATFSGRLKPLVKALVQGLLLKGQNIVLDFPANTPKQRAWLKGISDEVEAEHQLHFLDVEDEVCLSRIEKRAKEQPERAQTDTRDMFFALLPFFSPPEEDGLNVLKL